MNKIVEIIVPKYVNLLFDYAFPQELGEPKVGQFVKVPFSKSKEDLVGLIAKVKEKSQFQGSRLKKVSSLLENHPIVSPSFMGFLQWIANYYGTPLGMVVKNAFPKVIFKKRKEKTKNLDKDSSLKEAFTHELSEEQTKAVTKIIADLEREEKSNVFLIWGVTGSGKTEVYLRSIDHAIKQGKGALFILPEISLTPQMMESFTRHFGEEVALFHSKLTESQRVENWLAVASGKKNIVVGARSAIFAPIKNLGIIIVDEEHERTFKQEEAPRYHARDLAVLRGKIDQATVLLGSATPSFESYWQAKKGKYLLLRMKERISNRPLPTFHFVDMGEDREKPKYHYFFSQTLLSEIEKNYTNKEQTILFLNRRGFSNVIYCSKCQNLVSCKQCSISMTYHKSKKKLLCHRCEESMPLPSRCPKCKSLGALRHLGFGTEKVEKILKKIFPEMKVGRIDTDVVKKKGALESIWKSFKEGKTDVIVGTQMIAKGIDIANVTLVGVLAADLSINIPDFRSGERTFQLIVQVAGRAGRGEKPGRVVLQTYSPENEILQMAKKQDFEHFFNEEIKLRRELYYPPTQRFVKISIENRDPKKAFLIARDLKERASDLLMAFYDRADGPYEAPIYKIKSKYRWYILVRTMKTLSFVPRLRKLIEKEFQKAQRSIFIDVDPYSML